MASAAADPKKKPHHPTDRVREAIETIVFVVVLVLLLKLFVTEAFVIPTGSMAETLYGYQKLVTCPKCGHEFPVNSHDEEEPNQQTGRKHRLVGYTCPNCRYQQTALDPQNPLPPNRTGDRVLVLKPIYHVQSPERGDVVVFKFPKAPQERWVAANYIKRAMGFGGETVGIHRGDLYTTRAIDYPADARDADGELLYPRPANPDDLWRGGESAGGGPDYRYPNNRLATELFEASRLAGFPGKVNGVAGFEVVRKTTDQVLACRRIVWDNDQQPRELAGRLAPRWYAAPEAADRWKGDDPQLPRAFAHTDAGLDWVRYQHRVWLVGPDGQRLGRHWTWADLPARPGPGPVDNFLGYNTGVSEGIGGRDSSADGQWVGDLILECEAEVQDGATVVLELSKGQNRFQAKFGGGQVTLASTGPGGRELGSRPCKVNGAGKYQLRFANVDCRLRVWVNDRLVDFGTDGDYLPGSTIAADRADTEGYTEENDVAAPASVGAAGGVTVRGIKLFRDIYYTRDGGENARADLFYVQPGHYLCLGDNSAQSSDSRRWGLVPERLMLGKAVFVFWPRSRIGFIK